MGFRGYLYGIAAFLDLLDNILIAGEGLGNAHVSGLCHKHAVYMPAVGSVKLEHMPFNCKVCRGQIRGIDGFTVESDGLASVGYHGADVAQNLFVSGETDLECVLLTVGTCFCQPVCERTGKIIMYLIKVVAAGGPITMYWTAWLTDWLLSYRR